MNVKGSSMLIVAVGPTPGNTPTIVPIRTPLKQATRYFKEKKVINPVIKKSMLPIALPL
jgi:hypothetical protein